MAVIFVLAMAGCSQDRSGGRDITESDRSLFYGETLTIAVPDDFFMRSSVAQYMRRNPGVTIEIINFGWDNIDAARMQLATELMSGTGPVLIDSILLDTLDPRLAPFMIDWFPVMAADPDFNEEDWFTNALHALSVNGALYEFPIEFTYNFAAINSTVLSLNESFVERERITISEMIEIHQQLPAASSLSIAPNFSAQWLMRYYLHHFFDMETGLVDFDNDWFINFITFARDMTEPEHLRGFITTADFNRRESELAMLYLFDIPHTNWHPFHLADFASGSIFANPIPITNEHGELWIGSGESYILNAVNSTPTQQALAWDFIKFLMEVDESEHSMKTFNLHPTNRNLLRSAQNQLFPMYVNWLENHSDGWRLAGTNRDALEQNVARKTEIGNMPMIRRLRAPDIVIENIFEILQLFEDGHITAEQTAETLQSRIELIMMEIGLR